MSELDVQQFFSLSKDDISAVCERFRDDRRVAAAIQLLFLRASGRPMDRFATVPKVLLRSVCEALGSPSVSIASLRSLYERRQTLYEHQAWARTYLGLGDLDGVQLQKINRFSRSLPSRRRPPGPPLGCGHGCDCGGAAAPAVKSSKSVLVAILARLNEINKLARRGRPKSTTLRRNFR